MEEFPPLTLKFDGKTFIAIDYWWEDGDFHAVNKEGEQYCFRNCYPIDIKIEGLDYSSTEDITLVGSNRYYKPQMENNGTQT